VSMTKLYFRKEAKPEEWSTKVDVYFALLPEEGCWCNTREQAESDCKNLEHYGVRISSAEGQTHICKDFRVEERAAREFVIFCDAPFIPGGSATSGQSTNL